MAKLNINSRIIEDELERQGKTELLEAFKAMVGCNRGKLFNSLKEDVYKYNDPASDYYKYRQVLIDKQDEVMTLVENLGIDVTPLYDSFFAPWIEHDTVKLTCKELGITRKELAERIGVTPSAISQWGNEIPKTAQIALELMIENSILKKDLKAIIEGHKVLTKLAVQNLDS